MLLTGESDLAKGAGALLNLGPAAVLVPLGAKEAFCVQDAGFRTSL